jgi:predicted nucleotidyltransferase
MREEIVRRIVAVSNPDRIVLFGSRSRHDNRPESDYDILVVKSTTEPRHCRARSLYRAIANLPVEVDLLVYTPEEVNDWRDVPLAFITTAMNEGTVLYERAA